MSPALHAIAAIVSITAGLVLGSYLGFLWYLGARLSKACHEGNLPSLLRIAEVQYRLRRFPFAQIFGSAKTCTAVAAHCAGQHRLVETLRWCERGLMQAQSTQAKLRLLHLSAIASAYCGEGEEATRRLQEYGSCSASGDHPAVAFLSLSVNCYYALGRIQEAAEQAACLLAISKRLSVGPSFWVAICLYTLGCFKEVIRLVDLCLSDYELTRQPESANSLELITRMKLMARIGLGQWAECEQLMAERRQNGSELAGTGEDWVVATAEILAHRQDRQALEELTKAVRQQMSLSPANWRIPIDAYGPLSRAWQQLGDHDRAMEILSWVKDMPLPPINRSRWASMMSVSLQAEGQEEAALTMARQAKQLAPLAFWNRDTATANLPSVVKKLIGALESFGQPGRSVSS